MKKLLFNLRALMLLLLMMLGVGSVWAETIEINTTNSGVTGSYADKTFDVDDVTFGFTQWMKNTNIQAKKSTTNSCYNVDAIPGVIKKITVVQTGTARAIKMYGGTSSKPTSEITAPSTAATMEFNFSGKNYTYFSLTTPGNAVYMNTITIEYETSTTPATPPTAPTFSPAAGSVEKGTQITFSSETTGCTFRYTTDGTDPTATTGTVGSTYTVNSDVTLKVVAVKGALASETVSSASYTVNKHDATFYVNGAPNTTQYAKGDAINVPSDPEDINGKKFVGWSESSIDGTTNTEPSLVTPAATMGTSDLTYYAVFADAKEGTATLLETVGFESSEGYTASTTYNSSYYTTGSTGSKWKINYGAFSTNNAIVGSQSAQFRVYYSGGGYGQLMNTVAYSMDISKVEFSAKTANTNGKVKVSYSTNGSSWTDITTQSLTTTTTEYSVEVPVSGVKYIKFTAAGTSPSSGNYSIFVDGVKITANSGTTYSDYCTTVPAAKTLHHICVTGAKALYKVGDTFSTEGMTVTAYYDAEGNDSEVISSGFAVSKTSALTADDNTITISYTKGEVTKTADVSINVLALDHIAVTTAPTTTTYTEGTNFEKTGMVVKAYWGNTDPNVIEETIEDYTVTGGDNLQMGTESVTLNYQGKTTTQSITVTALPNWTVHFSINGTIDNANDKTCKQGQSITEFPAVTTATGVTFMGWARAALEETTTAPESYAVAAEAASYTPAADGETLYAVYKRTEETEYEGFKMSVVHGQNIVFVGAYNSGSYLDDETSIDKAEVFFRDLNDKIYIYRNEDGVYTQTYLYVTSLATNSLSNTKVVTEANSWEFTQDTDAGTYKLTGANNRKMKYNSGSGGRFTTYADGANYPEDFTFTPATKVIPTDYYSTTVTLPVLESIEITTAPTKTVYFEGDDFDKTGMVVTAHYNTKNKVVNTYTVSPETNLTTGTDKVTVSYSDGGVEKTADQTISVDAITLNSISVTTPPTKTTYKPGDSFDVTDMVVAAVYNDTRKNKNIVLKEGEADGYTVSPATFTEKGEQDVTISYTDGTRGTQTTTVRVQVNAALESIAVTTAPDKITYTLDEYLDKTGMVVTATYEGGSTADVTGNATTDFDEVAFSAVGQQTVTVTYSELGVTKTTTFNVTVYDYPTYTVTFNVNGTPTEVAETAGKAGVNPPATPAIGDYTFDGWSETQVTEETTDAPTYVTLTDGKYYPNAENAHELFAVYTKNKDAKTYGFTLSYVDRNSKTYYLGARSSGNSYFTGAETESNALVLYNEEDYLFYMSGNSKVYFAGLTTEKADITFGTKAKTEAWTIANTNGVWTFQSKTTGRYLACNEGSSHRFATYSTTYPYQLTKTASESFITSPTPHYTTAPSSVTTPTSSFAESSVSVDVVEYVEGERQFKSYTQAVTTNSTGVKTYSLSGDNASDIATIDSYTGTVTAKKAGTVTVNVDIAAVADIWNADKKSYTLTFQKVTPTVSFDLNQTSKQVLKENSFTFTMSTTSDATPYIVSTNSDVTIEGNVVTVNRATSYNSCKITPKVNETEIYKSASGSQITINFASNSKSQTIAFPAGSDKNFVKGDVVEKFTVAATGATTTVTYASNNESIAEVNAETGEVTVNTTAGGSATITATAAGDLVEQDGIKYRYNQSTATYTITVDNMARPVISVAGGNYDAAQTVTLTAADAFAVVYTLDGSDPSYNVETEDTNGEMEDPGFELTINKNCTLKVIAINEELDAVSAMAQATYTFNFPTAATTAWETDADIHMTGENYVLTAPEGATISYQIGENEKVVTGEQEVNISFEKYGKYNLTVDVLKNGLTTTSTVENLVVYGFADVPFTYDGNSSEMPLCFYGNTSDYSNSPKIQFKNKGTTQLTLMLNDGAAQLSYDYAFNGTWPTEGTNTFAVEMSIDGSEWETLKIYNTQFNSGELHSETLSIPSLEMIGYHYFRWTYTKVSGNWALGNIKVLPAGPDMTIAGEPIHEEAYVGTQVVKVGAPDAVIFYYTTDGTEPTTDSESSVWAVDYEALINVTESCTLKVVAANDNDEIGASTSAVITIEQPTEATDQNLIFERKAVHFTADETSKIANYEGQSVFGANTTVTYSVVNEGSIVATVNSETGAVRITSATGNGTATITATAVASGNWNAASASYTITVGNLPAPTLQIAGGDFNAEKYYTTEQFADLAAQGGYIAYTITYNDLIPEEALNGDIPGTSSDRVWLPSKYCEATGTYIDGVFEYDDPNDIDITKITIRAVAAMPYIREEGRVKHEEFRAVSDEATFVINVAQQMTLASKAELQGWKTFYNAETSFEVDENTSIYIAQVESNEVLLTKVDGRIVDADNPVLLKTTDVVDYEIHLIETATASGVNWNGNAFGVTSDSNNTGYVLAAKKPAGSSDKVLAFWKYTNLPAGMVYIPVASESASLRFSVVDEESTGIRTIEEDKNTQEILFNLTGLKVAENKGLMVREGKVVLVK